MYQRVAIFDLQASKPNVLTKTGKKSVIMNANVSLISVFITYTMKNERPQVGVPCVVRIRTHLHYQANNRSSNFLILKVKWL